MIHANDVRTLSEAALATSRENTKQATLRDEGEQFLKVRTAIYHTFGRAAADRCVAERGYALLDGFRFGISEYGGSPRLTVQTSPAVWVEPKYGGAGFWHGDSFANVTSATAVARLCEAGVTWPELEPPPPVAGEVADERTA